MAIAPAHVVAIALGVLGITLIALAFAGMGGAGRLVLGIVLLVIAMLTSGVQLLNRDTGAGKREGA
jgi:hypothetical protein